jgi:Zn-finger protein
LLIKNLGASEAMERRRDGNHSLKKIIQYSVENEENGYPVSDPNKTAINDTKEPNGIHKKTLKEEILEEITEKFMEKILDMLYQNVQDALRKCQDTKNKEHEKIQNQIMELREDFNKHQSEKRTL